MSSESELLQSDQQDEPIDINALVEQLTELEVKTESAIDDEFDDKPLFFKQKKEICMIRTFTPNQDYKY